MANKQGGQVPRQLTLQPPPWPAYGRDGQLTNFVDAALTSGQAAGLGLRWQVKLDGPIVASPLYADGNIYAATEAGSVYALAAATGALLWQRSFGSRDLGPDCGRWGISSTGALDLQRQLLYLIGSDGLLQGLSLSDGSTAPGFPLAVTDRPDTEYVWGGLRIVADRLYVPIASYCDNPGGDGHQATGRVVAVDLDAQQVASVFQTAPLPYQLAGVWGFGGVSVEPDGSFLYTGVGNSEVYDPSCDCSFEGAGYGNSLVRLTPDLSPLESNRPPDIPLHAADSDFGAAPLLFQPRGCAPLAAANNKDGYLYVWKRHALIQGAIFERGIGTVSAPFVGAPSFSPQLEMLFDAGTRVLRNGVNQGDGISAFSVDSHCRIRPAWQAVTGNGTQPPPLVVGDVVFAVGGTTGGFSVLDARSGDLLRRFPAAPSTTPPIWAGDEIVAGDDAGALRAFAPNAD